MVERVKEVTIAVYVDTNKNTYSEVFDDVEEGRDYLQGLCNDLFPDWSQKEIDKIKWISVKERLPELCTDVLVKVSKAWVESHDDGGNPEPLTHDFYSVMSLYYQGNQHIWDTRPVTETCPLKWSDVTHWMPLPEPPKEKK